VAHTRNSCTCTRAPSTSAHRSAYLRANCRKPPAGVIWDAAWCGSIHYVRGVVVGSTSTLCTGARARTWTWTWTRARWERGHMAHGAVWLRVRTLSVFLWRWRRTTCRGLADWWNWIVRLSRLEDWDTYISSVSGLAQSHPQSHHPHHSTQAQAHHHSSAHPTHLSASSVAGGSGQGSVR
jgi:hypothetical protein